MHLKKKIFLLLFCFHAMKIIHNIGLALENTSFMKYIPFVLTFVEGAWVCQKEEFSPKPLHFPVYLTKKQFKPCLFKGTSPATDSL